MTIDGVDIKTFHASMNNDLVIAPATVTTYDDWLRKSLDPLYLGKQETFKNITFTLVIEDVSDDAADLDISNISKALEKCTAKFDGIGRYFDCTLQQCDPERWANGIYQLSVTLKSSFAYLPAVSQTLAGQTNTITAQGNLPSPAVVTLTPTQDIGTVTLTGLTKRRIVVHNLHAGAPVAIDGKGKVITEADYDGNIPEAQGAGKWLFRKYSMAGLIDPNVETIDFMPTKDTIPSGQPYTQQLIPDGTDLVKNIGYDYLGYLKTAVYVSEAKGIANVAFSNDDGCSIYLNGTSVFGTKNDNYGTGRVTLNLTPGWNTIEFIWIQHYGPDGIYGITPIIGTQVDALNCAHAVPSASGGMINKFPDTDLWSFPVLQPGDNPVSIDSAVCGVKVEYNPKFM